MIPVIEDYSNDYLDDNEWWHGEDIDSSVTGMIQGTVIYFAVPAVARPIDSPIAAHWAAPTGPANDPIAPPTNEPTVEPMLLSYDAVPLSPDAISVNTQ